MRKTIVASLLILVSVLGYVACKKALTETPPIQRNGLIAEAQQSFYSTGVIQTLAKDDHKVREKEPIWKWARTRTASTGKVVIVPLQYKNQEYIKSNFRDTSRISLGLLSSLYIYKNKKGDLQYQVVTQVPDNEYASGLTDKFSGYIHVDDWAGNYIARYKIKNGHTYKMKDKPAAIKKSNPGNVKTDLWEYITTCEWTDVYGYNNSTGNWEYDETIDEGCSTVWIDLGDTPPPPDPGPGGGDEGGPSANDYAAEHYNLDDDDPFDGRTRVKLCGGYTWTKLGERGLYANVTSSGFTLVPDNPSTANPPLYYDIGSMCMQFSTANVLSNNQATENLNTLWNDAVSRAVTDINDQHLALGQYGVVQRVRTYIRNAITANYGTSASINFNTDCPGVPGSTPKYCTQ